MKFNTPAELESHTKKLVDSLDPNKPVIILCGGTGCVASKCHDLIDAFKEELASQGLEDKVSIRITGCHGFCEKGPLVVIHPEKVFYPMAKPKDVPRMVTETVLGKKVIDELLYIDPGTGEKVIHEYDVPFYKKQDRVIFADNGEIDPRSIDDYITLEGYSSLVKAFDMSSEEIIEEVTKSGLKGRGGAGFPTGVKWGFARKAEGEQKYLICNADEGDPGAYMDRSVLEGNPHSVIEGMIIGAYAIGASQGIAYVRSEYPLAVDNLDIAIKQARESGFLGENILGSGFDFDLKIYKGAGAFVCGEETALIASIEGRPGEPQQRPPFPAESGLWGCPTNINNVETWSNIPHIIKKGADWYADIGTNDSKGSKIFSLVGKITNVGLVEVPIGTTLRTVIYDIGGGIPDGKKFKAVQTGGPSGGCIPEEHLDTPIDYKDLTALGSIMGSGGLIVMDEDTCMVDVAKYFIGFTLDESCGKCTSCREGNARMLEILEDITCGKGTIESLDLLEELSQYVKDSSLCGLGKTAPNPVLTTLMYFRHEYEAHIRDHACPAKVCKDLIWFEIDAEKCTGCTACARKCPVDAITGEKKEAHVVNQDVCTRCGTCYQVCKFDSVQVKTGGDN
ncbi:MAG: NADH-quinone oxidoreductase subunit NuoF [Thermoplasmata archaeon]|nr:NADH-quinone oxidoreductase subunit NuoF [Thermoplasmata archaeon]